MTDDEKRANARNDVRRILEGRAVSSEAQGFGWTAEAYRTAALSLTGPDAAALDEALSLLVGSEAGKAFSPMWARAVDAFLARPEIAARVAGMGKGER